MPKIEIDEDEYNRLSTLRNVAGKIVGNPAAKKLLEQAHKIVDPNVPTPTLDAEAAHTAPIDALRKEFDERISAITKGQDDRDRDARIAAIAGKQTSDKAQLRKEGYTDEGIAAIEKIMSDKGLLDVTDAQAIFERSNPPPAPVTPGAGSRWDFMDVTADADKNIQDLISSRGSDQVVDRIARETINEARGGRR